MHDYFEILGLSTNAGAREIRHACSRRIRRAHPDFNERSAVGTRAAVPGSISSVDGLSGDVAIDFVDVARLVEGIQATFFGHGPRSGTP